MQVSRSIICNTDSYKISHPFQYPPHTEFISSYIEPRVGSENRFMRTFIFGIQAYLLEYLVGQVLTQKMIDDAEYLFKLHGVRFHREGWQYILDTYEGILPIRIEAVAEGTVVPNGNAVVQVINTDPKCWWLPSHVETSLLRGTYYPSTVATNSWEIKQVIRGYMEGTCDNLDGLPFKLHDFGARGVSSFESAGLGGLGHLATGFMGTDTITALLYGQTFYDCECAGFTPNGAAEHSTITSWGKDQEVEAYRNMLRQFATPDSIVAVVSDSYDIDNAVVNLWGKALKQEVIDSGAIVVIRPDSGDPVTTPIRVIEKLMDAYGYTVNTKGFKVLNNVRVIQGDGINDEDILSILSMATDLKISTDNINFGMGGGLLQDVGRDDCNFSMKASEKIVAGVTSDVFKESPNKVSKKGRLALVKRDGEFVTIREDEITKGAHGNEENYLRPIFENGKLLIKESLDTIRARSEEFEMKLAKAS